MVLSGNQATLRDIGIWAGAILPVLFVVQYTLIADWWHSPTGRALVALDACIWLTLAPYAISLLRPPDDVYDITSWVAGMGFAGVPFVILYRMVAFEIMRRHERRRPPLRLVVQPLPNASCPPLCRGRNSDQHEVP